MNYMEQVAKMLGVELEQEFCIKGNDYKYKITKYGMCVFSEFSAVWDFANDILVGILTDHYEIENPILTEKERAYLSNVIKPFREQVDSIGKLDNGNYECIAIKYHNISGYIGTICFPSFEKGTMYKGMEAGKNYTLEELEL